MDVRSLTEQFIRHGLRPDQIARLTQTIPGGLANIADVYPLSPLQEGMLFHHLLNQRSDRYVLSTLFELASREHLSTLIQAVQKIVDRHDGLRTALLWEQLTRPIQVVYRRAAVLIEELPFEATSHPVEQLRLRMRPERCVFDPMRAPMVKLEVICAPGHPCYALLQVHHLVCDFQSWRVIVREIMAVLAGREGELPVAIGYGEYAKWSVDAAADGAHTEFFRGKLGDFEQPTAPFGLLDVHGDGTKKDEARCPVDADLSRRIREQARRYGVSPARLFHAGWALVVANTSGRDDIVFGTMLLDARQRRPDAARTVGLFVNTLPLRLHLSAVSAEKLIQQTHRELGQLLEHQAAALSVVQRCSGMESHAPLFTALLNYRRTVPNADAGIAEVPGIRVIDQRGVLTNYPIGMSVDDLGTGFELTAQVDGRIAAQRVTAYLHTAMSSLVAALESAPQRPALDLSIVPEEELHRLLRAFNKSGDGRDPNSFAYVMFEAWAREQPEAVALVHGERSVTYDELNRTSNRLARVLVARGVVPDSRVAVCLERSIDMLITVLGVMKAGGAYVPLDPHYPPERIAHMLEDSAPVALVTQRSLARVLPDNDLPVVLVDEHDAFKMHDDGNVDVRQLGLAPTHLACIIYTSGSTGKPKGVMVEHAGLCNLSIAQRRYLSVGPGDRVLQFASFSFDACTWDWLMALCSGARLYIPSREELAPGEPLMRTLRDLHITHATLPPVCLGSLVASELPCLSTLIVAGEACPPSVANLWARGRRFINAYGPTEGTVCASMHEYRPQDVDSLPIGKPIANAEIHILDSRGKPVPIDVVGEIYLGGAGVTRGYLGKPELTSQRFIADAFSGRSGVRLYRTGDLGRWRSDGTIDYLGRNDHQVKIRGFRIELAEIEAQLARHPRVRESVVLVRDGFSGDKRLVAYVTPLESRPTVESMRTHLRTALPDYMIPSAFVVLDGFPLTPNGKVDRRALPVPQLDAYTDRNYVAPYGEIEQTLAGIWQELLRVQRVGRDDNFFELGGHSLLVMQVVGRLDAALNVRVTMRTVFEHPVLSQLADRVVYLRRRRLAARIADGGDDVTDLIRRVAGMPKNEVQQLVDRLRKGAGR